MIPKCTLQSSLVIIAFLIAVYGKRLLHEFVPFSIEGTVVNLFYFYAWWLIPIFLTVGILFGFNNIMKELCLDKSFFGALAFGLLTVAPMLVSSAILGNMAADIDLLTLFRGTFLAGFMEELLFRGFLFGILFRRLRWGFIPASVLGALIFGLNHVYQGSNPGQALGIFFITFVGAAWFAWLFIEWHENLWIPIFLHILMNLSWTLFDMSDNALGSMLPNVFRALTIAFTVFLTIRHCKKRGKFRINKTTLFVHDSVRSR